jgi:hypothetical protein
VKYLANEAQAMKHLPLPNREPLVEVCRCCGMPLKNKGWQPPLRPTQQGAFYVECRNPECLLIDVTATDVCYIETTNLYPPYVVKGN